ncbi:serine hydrolase domain-containing protein [Actinoplanes teichomyceticus]|uniref:D-alanyl-D-alanine carboxypeptidase n=1 Tax=Actinoplanes teichomyceticus TaxID=1867 RepID=A0A561WBT4_ACTTI|nr:serine hydrolase domain-containing protein [Actinoplanes teichomyceticus]TWG21324.1 D-alanyl-D-alanine carboxypeptidase [Actinoplanes teichomyceticus]GIF16409.1 hydrolase [Actinoplanes teichomyceticus]
MNRRQLLLSASGVAGTVLLGAPAAAAPAGPDLTGLVEDLHTAGIPGVHARVERGGRGYAPAAGVADLRTGRAARPGLRHRVGGVTKSFVAVTVLHLVGERRVDLDQPVSRYLPGVVPGDRGRRTTVRMLLNHTSGIADHARTALDPAGDERVLFATRASIAATATRRFTPPQLVARGLGMAPVGEPGALWSYSNTNYVLLAMLIERVTGRSYEAEVTRRVLRPLGLNATTLPGGRRALPGAHMAAYVPWDDGRPRDFTRYDMSWAWGGADLISTPGDVNRFYRLLLGGRVLPAALLREMMTTVPMAAAYPEYAGYGLGIFWLAGTCGRMWGHDGLAVGHSTYSGHAEDGHSVQFTLAENANFFPLGDPRVAAIDAARTAFEGAVFDGCGAPARLGRWWPHRVRDAFLH